MCCNINVKLKGGNGHIIDVASRKGKKRRKKKPPPAEFPSSLAVRKGERTV